MIRVVIACGRDWIPGDPCRQATPLGVVAGIADARERAARDGWTVDGDRADALAVDVCPACTRREIEGPTARRRATDRQPAVDACALPCCRPADRLRGRA